MPGARVLDAVGAALGAALLFALGSALQHRTSSVAQITGARPGQLAEFARSVGRNPAWAVALAVEAVGFGLHAVALHEGTLVLVQPLLVMSLVFALAVRSRLDGGAIAATEIGWSMVLAAGLALFLVTATPAGATTGAADRAPAIAMSVMCAVAVVGTAVGSRYARGTLRPLLLGVGAGVAFAGTAALIKASGDVLVSNGPLALLGSWALWAALLVGCVGAVLNQLAFQAGPLAASLPAIQTVDPVLSVVLGVLVYDEQLRHSAFAIGAETAGLMATLVAAVVLSRGAAGRPASAGGQGPGFGDLRPPGAGG